MTNQRVQLDAALVKLGPPSPDGIVGVWEGNNLFLMGEPDHANGLITVNPDDTYETILTDVATGEILPFSSRGTYTLEGNMFNFHMTYMYMDSTPPYWMEYEMDGQIEYEISGNMLTLYQDFDFDGGLDAIWTLTRN